MRRPMGGPTRQDLPALRRNCAIEACECAQDTFFNWIAEAVLVTYAGLFRDMAYPHPRQPNESDRTYAARCATAERVRLERTRHEGIHVIRYEVPPKAWEARDLERLMGLAYALLPAIEPRWRRARRGHDHTRHLRGRTRRPNADVAVLPGSRTRRLRRVPAVARSRRSPWRNGWPTGAARSTSVIRS